MSAACATDEPSEATATTVVVKAAAKAAAKTDAAFLLNIVFFRMSVVGSATG
jgi:hypothetical protein